MSLLYGLFGPNAFIVMVVMQIACIAHCVKTGRHRGWIFAILVFSALGCLVYLAIEVLPGLWQSRTLRRLVDPNRALREGGNNYAVSNNVETARQYAEQLMERGKYAEALQLYRQARKGLFQNDPLVLLGLVKASFGAREYAECVRAVDDLMAHHPRERTPEAHLFYARALEQLGRPAEALKEYRQLENTFPGPEAKCRYAQLLQGQGAAAEAEALFKDIVLMARTAPAHYQRLHREWISQARAGLKATEVS